MGPAITISRRRMNNIYRILASCLIVLLLGAGCSRDTQAPPAIALLAPFEGRYQEFGYDALYAARLALADQDADIDLIAFDDGGALENATNRARAIVRDEQIHVVIVTGPFAAQEAVQMALAPLPVIVIGGWNTSPSRDDVYILSHSAIGALLTDNASSSVEELAEIGIPIVGDERLASSLIAKLASGTIEMVSSAQLPSDEFVERYIASAEFAPQPGLLATLTYDASGIAIHAIQQDESIAELAYTGLNGPIHFENGYWSQAPVYHYRYSDGRLVHKTDS